MSKSWVQTHSGKAFDILEPRVEDVDLNDIAFSLAHLARYNGHAGAYNVALHSSLCCEVADILELPPKIQAAALMHDAHEAYLGDLVSPVKHLIAPILAPIERRIDAVIAERFGLDRCIVTDEWVAKIDHLLLHTEAGVFFPKEQRPRDWGLRSPNITGECSAKAAGTVVHRILESCLRESHDVATDIFVFLSHAKRLGLADA